MAVEIIKGTGQPQELPYALQRLFEHVSELMEYSRGEWEQRYGDDYLWYWKLYRNYVDRRVDPDDYRSNIGVAVAFPIIEILHARLMEPWLHGDELITALATDAPGRDREDQTAAYINTILRNRVPRGYTKHSMFKKAALIFGRGRMKRYIRYVPPMNRLKRFVHMVSGIRLGSHVDWDRRTPSRMIDYYPCDPFDVWETPGCTFLHEADYTFERGYWTTAQVHALQESGAISRDVEILPGDALGYDDFRLRRLSLEESSEQGASTDGGAPQFPAHRFDEFQGRCEWKEKDTDSVQYRNMRVILLNESALVFFDDLRTWDGRPSYEEWGHCYDPASGEPIGVIDPIEDLIHEINAYENMALDNARKTVESSLLVDPMAMVGGEKNLYLGPGEINWVKNPRYSVAPLEMKDLPRSFYEQIGYMNDVVQRVTGVSDYFGGMNTADTSRLTKTATGISLMANLSASRFGPLLASLDLEYYRPLAEWVHETAKLWMGTSGFASHESVRLPRNPESPFAKVGPSELDVIMEYSFNTKSLDPTRGEKREEFLKMVEVMVQFVPALGEQGYVIDFHELSKMVLDQFDRAPDAERLIVTIQDMMMKQQVPTVPGGGPLQSMYPGPPASAVPSNLMEAA